MPLDILIVGAGVCGPALATLLLRADPAAFRLTVVERCAALRTGGQQIDGIPVVRKMGLLDAVRNVVVHEKGMAFVDKHGNQKFQFGVNDTGKGQQGFTSEYEIMRGDLVRVLYDASLEASEDAKKQGGSGVTYEFGVSVDNISQKEDGDGGVDVTFSDGRQRHFDLVVGADGQGSRTRRQAWGDEQGRAAFRTLHSYAAYFTIPRDDKEDSDVAIIHHLSGRRMIAFRANGRPETQCYLICNEPAQAPLLRDATGYTHKSVDEQKQIWRELYADTDAWCRERVFDGLEKTEDFYAHEAGQVKLDSWSRGRVALLGDAGYCPSPVSGCGTTASLVGAYVLAGELARHRDDVAAALDGYDRVLRPFVDEVQSLPPGAPTVVTPQTDWGIWFLHSLGRFITTFRIDKLALSLMPADKGGIPLPEYPELKLVE
ncbi:FAD/NAD(P)-binding domain-containing protein [Apiospora phragmitis]|uniref:FAD/NAD(P)-binding domain-containing protein n=1 Tax=Apiospora phragmitis TaxID=2905665 RepID=A0ABR1U6N0_9PEZI